MIRRSAVLAVGDYQDVASLEDVDLWYRLAIGFRLAVLDESLLKSRVHPKASTYVHYGEIRAAGDARFRLYAPELFGLWADEASALREHRVSFALPLVLRTLEQTQGGPRGRGCDRLDFGGP